MDSPSRPSVTPFPRLLSPSRVTLVAGLLSLTSAAPAFAVDCSKDLDCPGDAVCEAGRCVDEQGAPISGAAAAPAAAAAAPPDASRAAAPAAPAAPATPAVLVPVELTARRGPAEVTDVGTGTHCVAPCTLNIPAGQRLLKVGGRAEEPVLVSDQGGQFSVAENASPARGIGAVLVVGGVVGTIVGGAIVLKESSSDTQDPYADSSSSSSDKSGVAAPLLGGGILLMVVGAIVIAASDGGGVQGVKPSAAPPPPRTRATSQGLVLRF